MVRILQRSSAVGGVYVLIMMNTQGYGKLKKRLYNSVGMKRYIG
jgi:hypothetical protein